MDNLEVQLKRKQTSVLTNALQPLRSDQRADFIAFINYSNIKLQYRNAKLIKKLKVSWKREQALSTELKRVQSELQSYSDHDQQAKKQTSSECNPELNNSQYKVSDGISAIASDNHATNLTEDEQMTDNMNAEDNLEINSTELKSVRVDTNLQQITDKVVLINNMSDDNDSAGGYISTYNNLEIDESCDSESINCCTNEADDMSDNEMSNDIGFKKILADNKSSCDNKYTSITDIYENRYSYKNCAIWQQENDITEPRTPVIYIDD